MKKKIGIFSVAIIACAMFFNANLLQNTKSDVNLASLIATNKAQAEIIVSTTQCSYIGAYWASCSDGPFTFTGCYPSPSLGCNAVY